MLTLLSVSTSPALGNNGSRGTDVANVQSLSCTTFATFGYMSLCSDHHCNGSLFLGSETQVNLDIPIEIMKGIQVRWPRRPWNRAFSSNPATRKCSWNGHRISYRNSSCLWYYSKHIRDICQGAAESCTPMSCLHWGWWTSIWATVVRCKMVR